MADTGGGEVGHHHIGSGKDAEFASAGECRVRSERRQCRGGWYQCIRKYHPEDGYQLEGQSDDVHLKTVHKSCPVSCERCVLMWDERTYSYHFRTEVADIHYVFHNVVECLERTSDHDSRSCLVSYAFQSVKALKPVFQRHFCRMQKRIVFRIVRFVSEKISCRPRLEKAFIAFCPAFSKR